MIARAGVNTECAKGVETERELESTRVEPNAESSEAWQGSVSWRLEEANQTRRPKTVASAPLHHTHTISWRVEAEHDEETQTNAAS